MHVARRCERAPERTARAFTRDQTDVLQIEPFVLDQSALRLDIATAALRELTRRDIVVRRGQADMRKTNYGDVVFTFQGVARECAKQTAISLYGCVIGAGVFDGRNQREDDQQPAQRRSSDFSHCNQY